MSFKAIGAPAARLLRAAAHGIAGLGIAGLVTACGGGSSTVDEFHPSRVISFGDEYSAFASDGRRYTINELDDDTSDFDCSNGPIWVQYFAANYDFVFPQCNPNGLAQPQAQTLAEPGATADRVIDQIDTYTAAGGTFDGAFVTLLVGTNDVVEEYVLYETEGEAALIAEMEARGERMAAAVNGIVRSGGRVILATAPDVGGTPFAVAERTTHTDIDRAALMSRMVDAFNRAMRVNIINDGSKIGLVLGDDITRQAVRFPSSLSLSNVTDAACTVALPDCTSDTLVPDAEATSYLWADTLFPGPQLHLRLGTSAVARATGNPF